MIHFSNLKVTLSRRKLIFINNEQGLTLLEVLVALLLLSMALVTMLNSFVLAGRQNSDTYRYNEALSLAQSKIEEIKKKNFNDVTSVAITDFATESDYAQFQGLSYKVTVAPNYITVNDTSILNSKTVTVTVYYDDEGAAKQLDLTTEVAMR